MKLLFYTLICISSISLTNAQGLFFDNIGEFVWVISEYDSSITFKQKEINLYKLKVEKDSIKEDSYLLTFNEQINIHYHNSKLKIDILIKQLNYKVINEKSKQYLRIYNDELQNEFIDYNLGIAATGSYVGLYRKKKRKKK